MSAYPDPGSETGQALATGDVENFGSAARAGATVLTFDTHFREIACVGALVL